MRVLIAMCLLMVACNSTSTKNFSSSSIKLSSSSQVSSSSNTTHDSVVVTWYPGRTLACKLESGTTLPRSIPGVAHRSLAKGTLVKFTRNALQVVAIVNDRGPMHPGIDFDISKKVAEKLKLVKKGRDKIQYEIVGRIK